MNSRPLIAGLADQQDVHCTFDVPARLAQYLDDGRVDVALLPIMDVLRGGGRYRVVSDGCIGCDGETMTVRIFSQVPPDRVERVWADTDSHTSVVLAQVLWHELFGRRLELVPLVRRDQEIERSRDQEKNLRQNPDRQGGVAGGVREIERSRDQDAGPAAVLLIGDKVVDPARDSYAYEVDLGAAWRSHTGLPFVFAVWARLADRNDLALRDAEIDAILAASRDLGVSQAADIARREAAAHGWPVELALRYLCRCLRFKLDERMVAGVARFAEHATALGLLSASVNTAALLRVCRRTEVPA